MKKILISIMLIAVMFCTGCSGLFESISKIELPKKETPVAQVADDNYSTYSQNNDADLAALESEIEAMGGYMEKYSSEEEYLATQNKKEKASAKSAKSVSPLAEIPTFEPVMQTITVMTTATGSEENGNYVPSKPLANAVVRIDGVPRYTDRRGQVAVKIDREVVEIYVEKTEYSPYIEVIEVTGNDKTVYLKKNSDNIDIYAAMFECNNGGEGNTKEGLFFNLLVQPCYILQNDCDAYNELVIFSNVEAETYLFYVNDEIKMLSIEILLILLILNLLAKTIRFLYNFIITESIPKKLNCC